jgi:hypothetical protein
LTEFEIWLTQFSDLATKNGTEAEQFSDIKADLSYFGLRGVNREKIRPEQGAAALSKKSRGLPAIRLYVVRMSENHLILLNGGLKTQNDPQNCPNVQAHFNFAVTLARVIDRERDSLVVRNNQLFSPNGTINIF